MGEILLAQEAQGGSEAKGKNSQEKKVPAPVPFSRTQLAKDAGLSKRQQVQAVNVARVPQAPRPTPKTSGNNLVGAPPPISSPHPGSVQSSYRPQGPAREIFQLWQIDLP
jgi:hypothetical protein